MKKKFILAFGAIILIGLTASTLKSKSGQTACISHESINTEKIDLHEEPKCSRDMFSNIDVRFIHRISREKLVQAKSIKDILPSKAFKDGDTFESVKISFLPEYKETTALGDSEYLNESQLQLLQSSTYSTDFYITAIHENKTAESGYKLSDDIVFYMSVVPEQEARYAEGKDSLMTYIKDNIRGLSTIIDHSKLEPGKIRFTISKEGHIKGVMLESSCGYSGADASLIDIVKGIPGEWIPARNNDNQVVEHELVLFYGIEGC